MWACAAFGQRAGFVVGFAAYASALLSTAAVIAGLGEYSAPFFGLGAEKRLVSLCAAVLFGAVALTGLKPSAWVWSSLTVAKLLPLLLLAAVFSLGARSAVSIAPAGSSPSWGRAVLVLVFPMQGFEIVPVPGSHVRSGARAIPIATVGSLVLCAALYAVLHWVCVRSVVDLARVDTPLIAAASSLGGARLSWLVGVGTNVSAVGIAFGMMAMTPRYLAALESSAARAPKRLLAQETANQVPRGALFVTLVLVVVLVSVSALSRLFVLSSVAVLFQYSVSVLSLAVLAFKRQQRLTWRAGLSAPLALVALGLLARAGERAEDLVRSGIIGVALLLGWVQTRLRR